jgi:hypothetical protein
MGVPTSFQLRIQVGDLDAKNTFHIHLDPDFEDIEHEGYCHEFNQ